MRRISRPSLDDAVQTDLDRRQTLADDKHAAGMLNPNDEWKVARRARTLKAVHSTLCRMMGNRERCMYCLDSHGSDIDHFWPKAPFPERMFRWPNLLLCCTECGRFKGDISPADDNGNLVLIDPTTEEPWDHLDFDPGTGNLVARFDAQTQAYSPKGERTVETLHFDRREALAASHQRTFRRLSRAVSEFLSEDGGDVAHMIHALLEADDHGLLGWCIQGTGKHLPPFSDLAVRYPAAWASCVEALEGAYP